MITLESPLVMDSVEVVESSGFMALEREWNELVAATKDEPFYRHEFLRVWLANFSPDAKPEIVTLRNRTGRLTAIFPFMKLRGPVCGVPARQVVSIGNSHSCRFDIVADDGNTAGEALFAHLSADKSWDLIRIADVPEDGNAWYLHRAAEEAGFPVGAWESQCSPYLPLPVSYPELQERMSTSFRANLRRRRRRLESMGTITIDHVTGGPDLTARLEECFAIEQSGWKGRKGTAILQDPHTLGFYTEMAHAGAARKYLSLFFLRINGKPIAFQYGFTYGNTYYMLKLGYDEAFKDCSPGLLLLEEIIKDCIERGIGSYDFLGPAGEWKTQWSDRLRRHTWLYIFRDSRFGKALQMVKFGLIPAAKRVLSPWKRDRGNRA